MISANIFAQQSTFESQIQQILKLDGLRRDELKLNLKSFEEGKSALNDIGTAFSSFQSIINNFENNSEASFQALKGTTSSDALKVLSTDSTSTPGTYDIQIGQVAQRDIVNSAQFQDTGTDLSGTGQGSFKLLIGEEELLIDIDTTGLTNQEVLNEIANEINTQSSGAVSASRLQVNDSESILSIKSSETGSVNQITIQDVTGDFQNLNHNHVYTTGELDANFTIDGVTFTRSSNTIDDVIDGVNFELVQAQAGNHQITVERDIESVTQGIESFVEAYNELNSTIRKNTFLNSESGNRGPLQRERAIRNLSNSMRHTFLEPVQSMSGESVTLLTDIGIEFNQDGSMTIEDPDKLESVILQDSELLNELFTASDGLISKIRTGVESSFSGDGSVLESIEAGFDSRIDRTNNRIEREERFLERREVQLRKEFAELQQIIDRGQSQFNQIMNFQSNFGL
ncbi:MAG: flagellar filament capping protein FliD [Balneolaceae bacterium]